MNDNLERIIILNKKGTKRNHLISYFKKFRVAESNDGHEDFQSNTFARRLPIIFKHLQLRHLQAPCWDSVA